jgi:catechol 2,3-dioxygenase-like lactoylglutathione lyase family enzyme
METRTADARLKPMEDAKSRPFRVGEIDHVVLRCADRDRALRFYLDVLGLVEERRIEQIGLIQLRAGRSMLDLVPAPERPGEHGRNVDHLCLGVENDNFDGLLDYLRARGVEMVGEPGQRYGARGMGVSVYIRDPEGNVIELKQMPPARQ